MGQLRVSGMPERFFYSSYARGWKSPSREENIGIDYIAWREMRRIDTAIRRVKYIQFIYFLLQN